MNSLGLWTALRIELCKRLREPLKQPPFVMYFLLAVVLGATGIWVALAESLITKWQHGTQEPLFRALVTFFPAIGSLACVQVIIVEDSQKSLRALFTILLITFLSLAIISGLAYLQNETLGFKLTLIGTGLAVLSLWLANINLGPFMEKTPDPEDSIGGPSDKEPAGDTEGYTT